MRIDEIPRVCFVGAGTMGRFNSLVTAVHGYECVLYDLKGQVLDEAPAAQRQLGEQALAAGLIGDRAMLEQGLSRISYSGDLGAALAGSGLVSESVPERLELKRQVHRQLDALCPPPVILTTNTSTLLVSEIEDVLVHGERFAALHFHLGGALLDIVAGPRTSKAIIAVLERFARSIRQTPMVLEKEKDGYLFNSMLLALLREALLLVAEGYGDFRDVDRSYMAATGQASGPFGAIDAVGLDVGLDVLRSQAARHGDEALERATELLRSFVERGELGQKSGKGFYTYPDPEFQRPEFLLGKGT